MRPILLQGHERALTQVQYNADGDLVFTVSKDKVACVWFSSNGERLGTYEGHEGTIWSIHVNHDSTLVATGSADNTIRLWNCQTGQQLYKWNLNTACKRVQFSPDGTKILAVTEERMGFKGTLSIYKLNLTNLEDQKQQPVKSIVMTESKATVAAWIDETYVVCGHENGMLTKYEWEMERLDVKNSRAHAEIITDLQVSPDRTYFITSSKDKTACIFEYDQLIKLKTYSTDTPLNSAAISPLIQDFVLVGGGQDAMSVTTTDSRQGKFEVRFWHRIFEEECGRVKGHFGPINTLAAHPNGTGFASGGEDGFVRIHHYDPSYYGFKFADI
ncbi:WD40 repeat-like protein [Ramicandelaber brevisporus]|nr:WD40 repeat-like protein [Ramicandelaber brevisporus]